MLRKYFSTELDKKTFELAAPFTGIEVQKEPKTEQAGFVAACHGPDTLEKTFLISMRFSLLV